MSSVVLYAFDKTGNSGMDFWNLIKNLTTTLYTNDTMNSSSNTWLDGSNESPFSANTFNNLLSGSRLFPTWKFVYLYDIMKAAASVIILMNAYVLLLSIRRPKFRTKSNFFLVNLAFTDLVVGAVCVPLFIISQKKLETAVYNTYVSALCMYLATQIVIQSTSLLTISNLFIIIAERFISLQFPLKHIRWVTGFKIKASLLTIWLLALVYSILSAFMYWPMFHFGNLTNFSDIFRFTKAVMQISMRLDKYKLDEVYCAMLVLLAGLSAILLLMMFITIHKRPRHGVANAREVQIVARIKKDLKALKILSIMVVTITIWLAPTAYSVIGNDEKLQYVVLILGRFVVSLTNPILFTLYKKDYQSAAKKDIVVVMRLFGRLLLQGKTTCLLSRRRKKDLRQPEGSKETVCVDVCIKEEELTMRK